MAGECIDHTPSWPGYRTDIAERKALMLGHLVSKEILMMMIRGLMMRNMSICIFSFLISFYDFFNLL